MSNYSIKDIEKLSGVKAGTIRIWEKRHGIVTPKRSEGNIRSYTDADVKKLMSIAILNSQGVKISTLAKLNADNLQQKVFELCKSTNDYQIEIDNLVIAMIDLKERAFEKIVGNLTLKYGFEHMVIHIIYPFLNKIGILWLTGNITPAQEHFITNLIRQKIIVAIDRIKHPKESAKNALLFLPEDELHELGLLFNYYLAKNRGYRVIYLGQSVPYHDLIAVGKTYKFDLVVTNFIAPNKTIDLKNYLSKLSNDFSSAKIIISGNQLKDLKLDLPSNIFKASNAVEFSALLK